MAITSINNWFKYINEYRETEYNNANIFSKEIAESLGVEPVIKEQWVQCRKTFFDENQKDNSYISAEELFKQDIEHSCKRRASIMERFTKLKNHKQL